MFENLIESASHQQDLARKGRYFLATLVSYALIVASAGLFSIYAYDAHVENQDLEFLGLVPPIVADQPEVVPKKDGAKPSVKNRQTSAPAQRTIAIDRVGAPTKIPDAVSANSSQIPEIPKSGIYTIGAANTDAIPGGPGTDGTPEGNGTVGPVVAIGSAPPRVIEKEKAPQPSIVHKSVVLNGEATFLPVPPYPLLAKTTRVQGRVNVQVTIDESGKIVSARATSGHPMLNPAAVRAALQARFNPTKLNGVPVKVSGIITYNFSLQ